MPILHFPQGAASSTLTQLGSLRALLYGRDPTQTTVDQQLYIADARAHEAVSDSMSGLDAMESHNRGVLSRLGQSHFFTLEEALPALTQLNEILQKKDRPAPTWKTFPSKPSLYGVVGYEAKQLIDALAFHVNVKAESPLLGARIMVKAVESLPKLFAQADAEFLEKLSPALIQQFDHVRDVLDVACRSGELNCHVQDVATMLSISFACFSGGLQQGLGAQSVDILQLSARSRNCIVNARIFTLGQIVQWSVMDLRLVKNLGYRSVLEIKRNLGEHGLLLRGHIAEPGHLQLMHSVELLGLSVRASNCLANDGVETIAELVQKTDDELLKISNFGKGTLKEIKAILAEHGWTTGMTIDD